MPQVVVQFNPVQPPAKLGTPIIKPTSGGRVSYAQNMDFHADEYGDGVAVPGPALTTIGNNSELTGVPWLRQTYGFNAVSLGYIYFAEGLLGAKNVIRRIKDVIAGSTPVIDTTGSMTASHSAHSTPILTDMIYRNYNSDPYIYVAGKDATDVWVQKFDPDLASPSLSTVATNTNFTSGLTDTILVPFSNNLIYWCGQNRVDTISLSDTHTAVAFNITYGKAISAGAEWQSFLLLAYSDQPLVNFEDRKSANRSGIIVYNVVDDGIERDVPCPSRYISAIVRAPDGNILVFGGVNEGRTTIYQFTGYAFVPIFSYIGDMPRSRHSVEFDGLGRLKWTTADGQLCRLDFRTGDFEHLGTMTTGSSAGGMLARGIAGTEFFTASGSGSTYVMKKVQFGSYIGDGDNVSDISTTPKLISGLEFLPPESTICGITLYLTKALASGEKIILNVHENGSLTPTEYLSMVESTDGAISAKRGTLSVPDISSYALSLVWKQTDGAAIAPPGAYAVVEYETTIN